MSSPPTDTGIWFHTFGCKANQYDTEQMRRELAARGGVAARDPGAARIAVINTCTVTSNADAEARRMVRKLKREHPELTIVVTGCSASLHEAEYAGFREIDAVVPGQDPVAVAGAVERLGLLPLEFPTAAEPGGQRRGTRAWLKVQDGCNRKCSFCATRLARGTSRSRPIDDLVDEARALARHHPEIVITGIHIGHYGRDLDPVASLAALCERLLAAVPARFRLSSIEATEIDDRLLEVLVDSAGALAPHLHVPLQSGSDRVLRAMRRWHSRRAYYDRVRQIAERMPRLGLGADVIVGFPGEGPRDFRETRALIEALPYTYLHVFPYSVREGTPAGSLPDPVDPQETAARSRILRDLARTKGEAYRRERVGETADVVVEGGERVTGGVTGDYLRVDIDGPVSPGDRVDCTLERGDAGLIARPSR